jgi:nucleoside phosphorylase
MLTIERKMLKLLVVAAWEPELTRFRERSGVPAGAVVVHEELGVEIVACALGVGVVEAAIAMTQHIATHRPTAALLLGTCGAFGPSLRPGSVATGARVRLVDSAVVEGKAALPEPLPAEATFDADLHDALVAAGAKSVHIANAVGITTDDELAARLAGSGSTAGAPPDVEHLEVFGFARACAAAGLPCAVALGVANGVGARGRAEWLANHVRSSADAADLACDALAAICARLALRTSTRAP